MNGDKLYIIHIVQQNERYRNQRIYRSCWVVGENQTQSLCDTAPSIVTGFCDRVPTTVTSLCDKAPNTVANLCDRAPSTVTHAGAF